MLVLETLLRLPNHRTHIRTGNRVEVDGNRRAVQLQRPNPQTVHTGDAFDGHQIGADFGHTDVRGSGFHEDVNCVAENAECCQQNEQPEEERANRVGQLKAGEFYDEGGYEDAHGLDEIAEYVNEGGSDVEIGVRVLEMIV